MSLHHRFTETWVNITVVTLDETSLPQVYCGIREAFSRLEQRGYTNRSIVDGLLRPLSHPGIAEVHVSFPSLRSVVGQWQGGGGEPTLPILLVGFDGTMSQPLPVPTAPEFITTLQMFRRMEPNHSYATMMKQHYLVHKQWGMAHPLPGWYYPEIPMLGREGFRIDASGPRSTAGNPA